MSQGLAFGSVVFLRVDVLMFLWSHENGRRKWRLLVLSRVSLLLLEEAVLLLQRVVDFLVEGFRRVDALDGALQDALGVSGQLREKKSHSKKKTGDTGAAWVSSRFCAASASRSRADAERAASRTSILRCEARS